MARKLQKAPTEEKYSSEGASFVLILIVL
jgi:hypothetical protein